MYDKFLRPGKADFILGGQFGSEAKGSASASLALQLARRGEGYDVVTCNHGAQAGHTSIHNGIKRVAFHLPTVALIQRQELAKRPLVYLNAGCIIDVDVLRNEIYQANLDVDHVVIHPNAAVITDDCREAEGRADSAQTKIASTRKGVGEAVSRKVLRSGMIAKDHPFLRRFVRVHPINLNDRLHKGETVCVETPQGLSLSVNSRFYPYTTSRHCTLEQGMNDAGIHPHFFGSSLLVLRTFPIRVGAIIENGKTLGTSGDHYPDQGETSWERLNQPAEITTVTKRTRRVFTFSHMQMKDAMNRVRPTTVMLTFCNYMSVGDVKVIAEDIRRAALELGMDEPEIIYENGATTDDVHEAAPNE